MASPEERKALNEATFRSANEVLEGKATAIVDDVHGPLPFLCECPRLDCTDVVLATLGEYEEVRSGPSRGIAATGHEDPDVENVVAWTDRFVVTEKVGRAGEVFAEMDRRS